MSGLLGGVLPAIYSQADRAKRYLGGLLSDPVGRMQQAGGQAVDDLNKIGLLSEQAFSDPRKPMKLQDNAAARQLVDTYLNSVLNFAPVGMHVWHGSPHKFDRFDSSKIGTGEGAQAYGHGLYLAESPDVAKGYAESVSRLRGGTASLDGAGKSVEIPLWAADKVKAEGVDSLIEEWSRRIADSQLKAKTSLQPWIEQNNVARLAQQLDELKAIKSAGGGSIQPPGSLYKVDLPDDAIAKMLDWDKPLSQQNIPVDVFGVAQRAQIRKLPSQFGTPAISPNLAQQMAASKTGSEAYRMLVDTYGPESAALALKRSGIPGIRYLDEGSRAAGTGTSNFVVFPGNEGLLSILERNGQPLR